MTGGLVLKTFAIGPNDAGQRLDKFMRKAAPLLPASLLYKAIRTKRIKRNRKRCQAGDLLERGDVLEVYLGDEWFAAPERYFLSAPAQLKVVYEDENLLLVDKPAGLIVHEDDQEQVDTLINRVQRYLYDKGDYRPEEEHSFAPALCNRIDRNTGGIVIAAKNFESLQILSEKIKQREVSKHYLCLVCGEVKPKERLLKGYHIKDAPTNRVQIFPTPRPGAKTALTRYRVLGVREGVSLLEVELLTGRTHQIRAHMAAAGHPLVGDRKYGHGRAHPAFPMEFQALYSYKLTFSFADDEGKLGYLAGKTFQVDRVPFAEPFCPAGR